MKRVIVLGLVLVMLIGIIPTGAKADDDIKLWVDGKNVTTDVDPYIEDSRTLVPIRFVAEALGYDVGWDNDTRTVTLTNGPDKIIMVIGSKEAIHNGNKTTLNKEPQLKDSRTFVPVRDVAERFGKEVDWDEDNWTVIIGQGYKKSESASQKGKISEAQAKEMALKIANGKITDFEKDDDSYEIEIFLDNYKYDIDISFYGVLEDIDVEHQDDEDDDTKRYGRRPIGEEAAKKIALTVAPGTVESVESDDGKYDIDIKSKNFEYDVEVNAYTGRIIKFERDGKGELEVALDFSIKADIVDSATSATPVKEETGKKVSVEEAKQIALGLVKNGRIKEFETDDGKYEIEMEADGVEYEVEIEIATGKVLKFDKD